MTMTPNRPPEFEPAPEVLQPLMPPIAHRVDALLRALSDAPTPQACDEALTQLMGARWLVLRLRQSLTTTSNRSNTP